MAEELLDTVGQLFGPVRGGLAYAAVLVGAVLAATTGVIAASVISMGLISLPIMMRYGYNSRMATGTIAAAGSLAQVIPPSLVLIVMADQLGRSVGDIYVGAAYPALILTALYCAYIFGVTLVRPTALPALPAEARTLGSGVASLVAAMSAAATLYAVAYSLVFDSLRYETRLVWSALAAVLIVYGFALANQHFRLGLLSRLAEQVVVVLIPPMALIFLVLGTIFLGIATPTEAGAMGAAGALIPAIVKRRMTWTTLRQALETTTKLSSFVMLILIGARVFGLTFYGVNGDVWIERLLLSLPGGEYGFLIFVTVIVFILGCFLDFFEIAFILVPLLVPAADKLGIDLIWFGIILSLNLQASFLTPPFGFALLFAFGRTDRGVARWRFGTDDRGCPNRRHLSRRHTLCFPSVHRRGVRHRLPADRHPLQGRRRDGRSGCRQHSVAAARHHGRQPAIARSRLAAARVRCPGRRRAASEYSTRDQSRLVAAAALLSTDSSFATEAA
jgi:TRAP-type mannitol/chloroaromatic compound transport system permease large subunit